MITAVGFAVIYLWLLIGVALAILSLTNRGSVAWFFLGYVTASVFVLGFMAVTT